MNCLIESFNDLKNDFGILEKNTKMTPYQSYSFLSITKKGMADKNPFYAYMMHEITFVLRNDLGKALLILPLLYKRSNKIYELYFRGQLTSAAHLDFIYNPSEYTYEMFKQIMDSVITHFGECRIHFSKIMSDSTTNEYIEKMFGELAVKSTEECVTIHISTNGGYDEWYNRLSKSIRQNIRTAYNRLEKEGVTVSYKLIINQQINTEDYKQMISLYTRRLIQKNYRQKVIEKILYPFVRLLKETNPMTRALCKMKNSCYGYLTFNDEIAACFWGLSCNDGRMVVPRLSYSEKYKVYCPGGLLIAETVKKLTAEYRSFTQFDLSCGNEKYKFAYGGISHFNNNYLIDTNKGEL